MIGTELAFKPISSIAVGASDRPIIIIIGPTTTGGNILLIHSLPTTLIIVEIIAYTIPTHIIAVKTLAFPAIAYPATIGAINANELPR